MKKILVPCDFSDPAKQAYLFALDIASKTDAEIFVVRAFDVPFIYESFNAPNPFYLDPGLLQELENDAKISFEKMKAMHSRQDGIRFNGIQGPVTPTLLNFIDQEHIDLVIMGTHGTSGLAGYLIGSNTEKIVRSSPVPVIAIRTAVKLASIRNIVFATTLQKNEMASVTKIKELQTFFDATLHLLLVNTPVNLKRTKDEMAIMEEYVRQNKIQNCTMNLRDDFNEQDGIMGFAQEINADMIALTTHGRRGLAHLFLGSVAEDVVNHASCPIWTYSIRK